MKARQTGFTLVELIVIIAILGILAAVAIPRYVNNTQQARIGVLNGVTASIRGAVQQTQGLYQIAYASNTAVTTVTLRDGTTVTVTTRTATDPGGLPVVAAGGIDNAVTLPSGMAYDGATGRFYFTSVGNVAGCGAVYATPRTAANPFTVTITSTAC